MESLDYLNLAKSRYTDQHRFDPAFVRIVEAIVEHREKRQAEYIKFAEEFLDIDKAQGKALDLIGSIVGQKRELANFINKPYFGFQGARLAEALDVGYWYNSSNPPKGELRILNDEEYRRVIKARIIKNRTNNNRDDLLLIMNYLTGNSNTQIEEVRHGVIKLVITNDDVGLASYFLNKRFEKDALIPIPLGYRLGTEYKRIEYKYFKSQTYPQITTDAFNLSGNVTGGSLRQTLKSTTVPYESITLGVTPTTSEIRQILKTTTIPLEAFSLSLQATTGELRQILRSTTVPLESLSLNLTATTGELNTILINQNYGTEAISLSLVPTNGELNVG